MQVLRTVKFFFGAQTLAQFFGALRRLGQTQEQRAEVESRPGGQDGKLSAPANLVQSEKRPAAVFPGGENFVGVDEIDEVMRNSALLVERNFGSAEIEAAINLGRIANENFAA